MFLSPLLFPARFCLNIAHLDIREQLIGADVEIISQRAKEKCPDPWLRIVSDNGPMFMAKEFKDFIRISGMTNVIILHFQTESLGKCRQTIKMSAS